MGQKIASRITKRYKNASRLNRYIPSERLTQSAFYFQHVILHHFLCVKIPYTWGLAQHSADVTRSDISWGSPQLQVGAFNSRPVAIDVFSSFIRYGDMLCKVNALFGALN